MPKEPNPPNRDQRKSQNPPEREGQRGSTAQDRVRNPERRGFQDREADELENDIERETGLEDDDEDIDDMEPRDR